MSIVKLRFSRRLAISPDQGQGWSEFCGEQWIQPHLNGGAISVVDANGSERLIFDCGSPANPGLYEMGTYDQLLFSSPSYLDKAGIATVDGGNADIAWAKYCGEIVADTRRQNDTLELLETHIFVRPQVAMNDGRTGYDDNGMREGFELSVEDYTEGNLRTPIGIATDVPPDGDIVFSGVKVEGRRHQFRVKGNKSELKVTGISHSFASKPRPAARINRETGDTIVQANLMSDLEFWCSRGKLGYDRVSKHIMVTDTPLTKCLGPDGRMNAMLVGAGGYPVIAYTNDARTLICCGHSNATGFLPEEVIGTPWDGWSVYCKYIPIGPSSVYQLPPGAWYDIRMKLGDQRSASIIDYYNNIRYSGGAGFLPSA
jgi:hypothetical protein